MGFLLGAIDGGFFEERSDVFFGKFCERCEAAFPDGRGPGRVEAGQGAVLTSSGARTMRGMSRFWLVRVKKVGPDSLRTTWRMTLSKNSLSAMAVEFPVAGIEIEFDRPGVNFTINLDSGAEKVGAGAAIPFAG